MTLIIRIVLFVLGGVALLGAFWFFRRGFGARVLANREAYNVARLNARRIMSRNLSVAGGFLAVALVFFGAGVLVGGRDESSVEAPPAVETLRPTETSPAASPTIGAAVSITEASPTPTSLPVSVAESTSAPATPEPPPTATSQPTAVLERAIVNSPIVGLYLRSAPNGEILTRLEDQTELVLLGEELFVAGLRWVRVSDPAGSLGWVAAEFLLIGDQIPPAPPSGAEEGSEPGQTPTAEGG